MNYILKNGAQHGVQVKVIEVVPGNSAKTLHSALLAVEGDTRTAEFVSSWEGPVQWIGTSMFRPNHKRKNWFVSIKTLEPIDESSPQIWHANDIQIERMRSSGPGGQHANKTETAIRVTHTPTGLSALSQEERSQYLNKKLALTRLKEVLMEKDRTEKKRFDQSRWNTHNDIERGNANHVFTGATFQLR
jgi:peptide chain release factor